MCRSLISLLARELDVKINFQIGKFLIKGWNGRFNTDVALSMKDREETSSLDEEFQTINLLSKMVLKNTKRNIDMFILVWLKSHFNLLQHQG